MNTFSKYLTGFFLALAMLVIPTTVQAQQTHDSEACKQPKDGGFKRPYYGVGPNGEYGVRFILNFQNYTPKDEASAKRDVGAMYADAMNQIASNNNTAIRFFAVSPDDTDTDHFNFTVYLDEYAYNDSAETYLMNVDTHGDGRGHLFRFRTHRELIEDTVHESEKMLENFLADGWTCGTGF